MKSRVTTLLLLCGALFALNSCSGVKDRCVTNCGGGGGNATLNLTISDTPPSGVSVISFTLPISGISISPSTGSDISVYSGGSFELTHLQSDSAPVVTGVSLPAGTYTALKVTLGTSSGTFINASNATITYGNNQTCAVNAVCALPNGGATTITTTFTTPITLSANQNQWFGIDVNLNNAITSTSGISVDFTLANVLKILTTPRTNATGYVDSIDDFSGIVTSYTTGSKITVTSGTRGTLTGTINASTTFDDPQGLCSGSPSVAACINTAGKTVVSVQAYLSTTGVITVSEIDVLDTSGSDTIEGLIYPSSCNGGNNFGLILFDSSVPSANATLTGLTYGAGFCLTISPTAAFLVDSGLLTGAGFTDSQAGFASSSDITSGQVVRVKISKVTAGTLVTATANSILLRYSRLSGTVNTVSANNFSMNGLPTYLGFLQAPLVATYQNNTIFEGVTGINDLSNPRAVAIRALFFKNSGNSPQAGVNFFAAKVRAN